MKGLLLKDWFVVKRTCRTYCLIILLFAAVGVMDTTVSTFYTYYPCIMAGVLVMSLLSMDERCKWTVCCQTMPVSRTQYVFAKYLFSLLTLLAVLVLTAVTLTVRQLRGGGLDIGALAAGLAVCLSVGLLGPALMLPFLFWLGSEKGRLAYYVVLGATFAISFALPDGAALTLLPHGALGVAGITLAAALLFAASAAIAAALYRRREL